MGFIAQFGAGILGNDHRKAKVCHLASRLADANGGRQSTDHERTDAHVAKDLLQVCGSLGSAGGLGEHHLLGQRRDAVLDRAARVAYRRADALSVEHQANVVELTHPLRKIAAVRRVAADGEVNDGQLPGAEAGQQAPDAGEDCGVNTLKVAGGDSWQHLLEYLGERVFRPGEEALNINDDERGFLGIDLDWCLVLDAEELLEHFVFFHGC